MTTKNLNFCPTTSEHQRRFYFHYPNRVVKLFLEQKILSRSNFLGIMSRQLDISRNHGQWLSVPHFVPGRLNASDHAFFNYDSRFPAHLYRVSVESMSNASPNDADRYRDIGPLSPKVELPDVHFGQGFGSHAKIMVLPLDGKLPAFVGNLQRGSTYTIRSDAQIVTRSGHRALARTGVA